MIGISLAIVEAVPLILDKSTNAQVYPLPPADTITLVILPLTTSTTTLPPLPSPTISNSCPNPPEYPDPWFAT